MKRVKASASPDHADAEDAAVAAAEALLKAHRKQQQDRAAARRAKQEDKRATKAAGRARKLLEILESRGAQQPPGPMRNLVQGLVLEASLAGPRIDAHLQEQINAWKSRADDSRLAQQTARRAATPPRDAVPVPAKRESQSPDKAKPERSDRDPKPRPSSWNVLDVSCPTCDAPPGTHCLPHGSHPHQARLEWFRRRFPRA